MMHFNPLTLSDLPKVRPYFAYLPCRTCDYTVGVLFLWREYFSAEYAITDNTLFTRLHSEDGTAYYNLPLGPNLPKALGLLRREVPGTLHFCTVPEEYLSVLTAVFPEAQAEAQEEYFDYLYRTEDLVTLSGKKYAGQRNHISQFRRNTPVYSFEPIQASDVPAIKTFLQAEYLPGQLSPSQQAESRMVPEVLDNLSLYGMTGYLLKTGDTVLGFSLGEVVGDTLFVHIEKALRSHKGAYQMLSNQFAAHCAPKDGFINREDDMGSPGLRASKLSYHPIKLLKKYAVTVQS